MRRLDFNAEDEDFVFDLDFSDLEDDQTGLLKSDLPQPPEARPSLRPEPREEGSRLGRLFRFGRD